MLCLGIHRNVMHRFTVQAFQDPPLCSSTFGKPVLAAETEERQIMYLLSTRNSRKAFGKSVLTAVTEERPKHLESSKRKELCRKALGKPVLAAERQTHVYFITNSTLQLP
jgi:hypothetical protein